LTAGKEPDMAFGPHLTVDGIGCSHKNLSSMSFIYKFLNDCPKKIDMTKITEPYIVKIPEGYAGMILIAESHISVHTIPKKEKIYVDIFSCKEFDKTKALKYIVSYFKPKHYEEGFIQRGKKFPRWNKKKS
jgi:S-adenosylmethionine decarboxylase